MSKFTTKTTTVQRLDRETGEVIEYTDRTEIVKNEAEPFFLTYSKQIMALYDKPIFNATTKVFWKLLEFAEFNTGKVYMNCGRKKEIMDVCGISRASYDRAIKELVDAEIMKKDQDTYTIDEKLFWKGDRKTREALMEARLKITLSPEYSEEQLNAISNLSEELSNI